MRCIGCSERRRVVSIDTHSTYEPSVLLRLVCNHTDILCIATALLRRRSHSETCSDDTALVIRQVILS